MLNRSVLMTWSVLVCLAPAVLHSDSLLVTVSVSVESEAEARQAASGRLEIRPLGGAGVDQATVVEAAVEIPGRTRVELPGAGVWQVVLDAPGYWTSPAIVTLSAPEVTASLEAWPTGMISGAVRPPSNESTPAELKVRFEPSSVSEADGSMPRSTVVCPIEDQKWHCELPATGLDLRLRATGYVSHYRWDVQVPARKTLQLGTLGLRRGASLVGWVAAAQGHQVSPSDCTVSLEPAAAGRGPSPADRRRFQKLSLEEKVGDRGFFHFTGISPGSYRVTAVQKGLAPARIYPVEVMANAETELQNPLVLELPLDLEVRVDPPHDLFGNTWKIAVTELSDIPGHGDEIAEGRTSEEGLFIKTGLGAGSYLIVVSDSRGSKLAYDQIRLSPRFTQVDFHLPLIWVQGELSLGGEPLSADLWFGGPFGAEKVRMSADEEGKFTGYLPRGGDWLVHVDSDTPPIQRELQKVRVVRRRGENVAHVEIELPDTELEGAVVDEQGRPADALVNLYEPGATSPVTTLTGEDGRFGFHGLAEGRSRIVAANRDVTSDEVWIDVAEEQETAYLRLILRPRKQIPGQILAPAGALPGAEVWATAYGTGGGGALSQVARATTDVTGRFELSLPAAATHLQVTVFPPGYVLRVLPIAAIDDQPLTIEVEPHGGFLHLELEEPVDWRDLRSPKPAFFVDGIPVSAWTVEHWRRIHGQEDEGAAYSVPAMPAGHYTACLEKPTASAVAKPGSGCVEGHLVPTSQLSLSLRTGGGSS